MDRNYETFLVNEWISCVLEDSTKELQEISDHPYPLLYSDLRSVIWDLCQELALNNCSVPAQAYYFLERYLYTSNNNSRQVNNGKFNYEIWDQHTDTLSVKFAPMVAASIYVAMKMYSKTRYQVADVRPHLVSHGISFTNDELIRAEFDILRAYDFKLPVWSSLDKAELLCIYLSLPETIINGVEPMLSLAELKSDLIKEQLENHLTESRGQARILSLHLAAGAVCATVLHFKSEELMNTRKMEKATGSPFPYISCIAGIILTFCR